MNDFGSLTEVELKQLEVEIEARIAKYFKYYSFEFKRRSLPIIAFTIINIYFEIKYGIKVK